jgi:hypothetical protein
MNASVQYDLSDPTLYENLRSPSDQERLRRVLSSSNFTVDDFRLQCVAHERCETLRLRDAFGQFLREALVAARPQQAEKHHAAAVPVSAAGDDSSDCAEKLLEAFLSFGVAPDVPLTLYKKIVGQRPRWALLLYWSRLVLLVPPGNLELQQPTVSCMT